MNIQTETKPDVSIPQAAMKTENPMQERYCGDVSESVELTAEAAFTARRLEARGESGPIFVP